MVSSFIALGFLLNCTVSNLRVILIKTTILDRLMSVEPWAADIKL